MSHWFRPLGGLPAGHLPQVDGLRGVAILLVFLHHGTELSGHTGVSLGWLGVWLFYVISGFLITGILLRSREIAGAAGEPLSRVWRAFWARRALRIFPLYYAALFAAFGLGLADDPGGWPWYAVFLANYRVAALGAWPNAVGHFWSLAVEEQFYLVWPAVCLLCSPRRVAAVSWACVLAAPAVRFGLYSALGTEAGAVAPTPSCLDGLGLGALLSATRSRPGAWALGAGAGLGALVAAARVWGGAGLFVASAEGTAFSLVSWWAVGRAAAGFGGLPGRLLVLRPVLYLGKISYGLYVIHFMVPRGVARAERAFDVWLRFPYELGWPQTAYVFVLSLALASASWYALERPLNGLKRYLPYVRAGGAGRRP